MTIVSLFRRYKRWNPVHPTYGAFWGIGLGVGCGVGWGPGFGPEVVGYVGSGCGVGISMGVTLVGVGVGLPASGLTCVPCNVVTGAGQKVQEFSKWVTPGMALLVSQTWNSMNTHISLLEQQLRGVNGSHDDQGIPQNVKTLQPAVNKDLDDFDNRPNVRIVATSHTLNSKSQQGASAEDPSQ